MAKNLNTVFPFYDSASEQYRHREDVESLESYPCLVASSTNLIPFVIRVAHSEHIVSELTADLYDYDTNQAIATYHWHVSASSGFVMSKLDGASWDYYYYTGTTITAPSLPTGRFYLVITHPHAVFYSEVFVIMSSVADYIKLDFSNNTEISSIMPYFYQTLYVDAILKTPEYIREDTGDRRNGILVPEKKVVIKSEALRILMAPEYIVDAIVLLPLMDNVLITKQGEVIPVAFSEVRVKDPEPVETAYGTRFYVEIQLLTLLSIKKLNFKEMGYTETTSAIIKAGTGTTAASGNEFVLAVVFDEAMPDAQYTPAVTYCQTAALPYIPEMHHIQSISTTGFTIYTPVACNVRWTAIHV